MSYPVSVYRVHKIPIAGAIMPNLVAVDQMVRAYVDQLEKNCC